MIFEQKAKSDNKYFAACREKETGDITRKTQQRTIEKQGKVIDRLTESDAQLRNQLVSLHLAARLN
jgi:E3 ubiquitin-protein ligase BRE1